MKKFDNYCKNLNILKQASMQDMENEFIISGIIDKFSLQFELSWKVLKEMLLYEGSGLGKTGSPREIIKESYKIFDFLEEDVFLHMLKDRNDTSHIYDGKMARGLVERILKEYIPVFIHLQENIENERKI